MPKVAFFNDYFPATESSLQPNKESADKGLSATATAYAPSNASSKAQEKMSSNEASEDAATVKTHGATQPAVSRARPGSSASSTSECGNPTPAASGPGLSPSSSVGSLTSEKSTLNPHAKVTMEYLVLVVLYKLADQDPSHIFLKKTNSPRYLTELVTNDHFQSKM